LILKKALLLSQYDSSQATTRIRILSLIKPLNDNGFNTRFEPLISWDFNKYPRYIKFFLLFKNYLRRLLILLFNKYDLIIFNREIFPKLPFFFDSIVFISSKKVVMDLDDGIHLYYLKSILEGKIERLVQYSDYISLANVRLASYFKNHLDKISINYPFPDKIYKRVKKESEVLTIGWIGSTSTTKYLENLLPILEIINKKYDFKLLLVGASDDLLKHQDRFLSLNIISLPWSQENEKYFFENISLGLMPLDLNDEFSNFKSGYKLIQYLAHSIPCLASKNDVTFDIVRNEMFLCDSESEWLSRLDWFFSIGEKIQLDWMRNNVDSYLKKFNFISNKLIS
tara:strand:- start:14777 stop:15796 length:1020 start_codon:yes stop_codon:yes gene_type:complete